MLDEIWRAAQAAEDAIETAIGRLNYLHIVARDLAQNLGCAPVPHMESLSDVLDSDGADSAA